LSIAIEYLEDQRIAVFVVAVLIDNQQSTIRNQ